MDARALALGAGSKLVSISFMDPHCLVLISFLPQLSFHHCRSKNPRTETTNLEKLATRMLSLEDELWEFSGFYFSCLKANKWDFIPSIRF